MLTPQNEIRLYQTVSAESPFEIWLKKLKDQKARFIIRARLDRLAFGLLGKCEPVSEGIFELKIFYGPGYRIYFGQEQKTIMILLLGGDKSTQSRDIEKAKFYWRDYQRRK